MIRLAILGSGRGTNLPPLIQATANGNLLAEIAVVISNKSDAILLVRARDAGVSTEFVNPAGLTREAFDAEVSAILKKYKIDLIVLSGYMRILSAQFVHEWQDKIINVHPSLLPAYAGKMDLSVHEAVLAADEKETGCTVHLVTEEVDAGPILLQRRCRVLEDDTPETLKQRVQALEAEALIVAINDFVKPIPQGC